MSSGDPRLPTAVTPIAYRIELEPDLVAHRFVGAVAVDVEVHDATDMVTLNAAELEVERAWVDRDGERFDVAAELDAAAERLTLRCDEALEPGSATVHVAYRGTINDKLRGFYRSSYRSDDGGEITLGVTQFEATDARRAFPCWDEPEHKATFELTLTVDDDHLAVSNTPVLESTQLDDGRRSDRFGRTMKMSTYLVAWVVGPLEATEPVDVDGVPLRIVHRPGQGHLAGFALDVGAFCLRYFADYYGIDYPGQKVDLVAVPDFAFGAMENLGCVTFRETLLLVDPESSTQAELMAVVDVVAHELAHMWFGDLVTMRWWNGIWLNEAFATFMEMKATDAYRPDWKRWMHFGRERSTAFDTDALASTRPIEYEVRTPADAEGMFDVLTYQKGSAVVRMLEQFLGEDRFRDGIRRYLSAHAYANTETTDLWDALEDETGESVRSLMDSWIFQGGFPLVEVRRDGDDVGVGQAVFRYLEPDGEAAQTRWEIPLIVRSGANLGRTERRLLDADQTSVACEELPVVANGGGHAFFRTDYDDATRRPLVENLSILEPLERYSVLDDTWALVLAGRRPGSDFVALLALLADMGETDLAIWEVALGGARVLGRIAEDRDRWKSWLVDTLGPVAGKLGQEPQPGDDDRDRALRGMLFAELGLAGEESALLRAPALLASSVAAPSSVDPSLAAGALRIRAAVADQDDFDTILDRFRNGRTPQEQVRFLYALASVRDRDLFLRYLDFLRTDEVRSQNVGYALRDALGNVDHGESAWQRIVEDWDRLMSRLPSNNVVRMLSGIRSVTDAELAEEIETFLADREIHQPRTVDQHIERMRVGVALRRRESARITDDLP